VTIEAAVSLLWCVTVAQGLFLFALYRQVGVTLLKRAEAIARDGPRLGSRLPFEVGSALSDHWPVAATQIVIVFARPACIACKALWPQLQDFTKSRGGLSAVIIMGGADADAAAKYARDNGLDYPVLADPRERFFDACAVRVSPFAVLTDANSGVNGKGLVNHAEHLRLLFRHIEAQVNHTDAYVNRSADATQLVR